MNNMSQQPHSVDFVALADQLQKTAQALLTMHQTLYEHEDSDELEALSQENLDGVKASGEVRSYEIPAYIIEDEQELLAMSDSEDVVNLLNKIYDSIHCVVHLMEHIKPEEEVSAVIINGIAEVLLLPLGWLEQLCQVYMGYRLIDIDEKD